MHMNNTPLYRTPQWGIPITMPSREPSSKAPSKVVSIPIRFVGSNSDSDSERVRTKSAIKIQKVTRGFLVRKALKKINAVRVEVEQIETKVFDPHMVELIERDHKERVRVSETIMNLLLRLDSVRVPQSSGVRDCRKSVIKKAIALQEMVDQMVGPTDQDEAQAVSNEHGDVDADADACCVGNSEGKKMVDKMAGPTDHERTEALSNEHEYEDVVVDADTDVGCVGDPEGKKMVDQMVGPTDHDQTQAVSSEHEDVDADADSGCVGDSEGMKMEGMGNEKVEVEEEEEGDGDGGVCFECVGEESVGTCVVKEEKGRGEDEGGVGCVEDGGEKGDGDGKNRELLEKMIEDNERMMRMMAQLFERNEMQTRLLSSLSQRVEQLERAFACDKLRRKRRRNVNADAKHKQTHPEK